MPLLNHTTQIPIARTLAEIARAIPAPVTLEREHGRVSAVTLRYAGELYRLSPNVEGAWKLLNQSKGLGLGGYGLTSKPSAVRGAAFCSGSGRVRARGDGPGCPQDPAGVWMVGA